MEKNTVIISGSNGLVGSSIVKHLDRLGYVTVGIDADMRKTFFGDEGSTLNNLHKVAHKTKNFKHIEADIRDFHALKKYVFEIYPDALAVVHCASQPAHNWPTDSGIKDSIFTDFEINARGTLNMLELFRNYSPNGCFINFSTNKVTGDACNKLELTLNNNRYYFSDPKYSDGIEEDLTIDDSLHSLFGVSKLYGDSATLEYAKYFNLSTVNIRMGCCTGSAHAGVSLHGFLNYITRMVISCGKYTIYGNGLQTRDQLNSKDLASLIEEIIKNPPIKGKGEIYTVGGGKENSLSILNVIDKLESMTGKRLNYSFAEEPRKGDHICWYASNRKVHEHYPNWKIKYSVEDTLKEIITSLTPISERYSPCQEEHEIEYFNAYANAVIKHTKGRCLDLGSGEGHLTVKVAANPGVNDVMAVDNYTGERQTAPNVHNVIADIGDFIEKDHGDWDTVLMTESMEHLPESLQILTLSYIRYSLRKNGCFVGSMPVPDDPNNTNPYHLKTYTMEQWGDLLKKYFKYVGIKMVNAGCYAWRASN